MSKTIEALEAQVAALKEEVASLKSERQTARSAATDAQVAALKEEVANLKSERQTARSAATKAENKLVQLEAEVLKMESNSEQFGAKIQDLITERDQLRKKINAQAEEIQQLETMLAGNSGGRNKDGLSIEQLQAKAQKVLQQEKVSRVYITPDGYVFRDENTARNYGPYKIAEYINGKEVTLSEPSK